MKRHPFLEQNIGTRFPSQNVSLKIKNTDDWKEANMDAYEFEARRQYLQKQSFYDNYKIANDELVLKDYGQDDKESFDLIQKLTEETGLPDVIKNYGIVSQPIATLEGEMDSFPDVFNVKGVGDIFESEKNRVKTQLLKDWFMMSMQRAVDERLAQMQDSNPDADLFQDEEQYQQAFQEQMSIMYPPQIQKYMTTEYKHVLELWGQFEMKDQFERFRLKAKRREEFFHWLRVAQRFRHLYVSPRGLEVESLNPIYTFALKSPNKPGVQEGFLAGFGQSMDVSAVIDRYGDLMTDEQINSLQTPYKIPSKDEPSKRPDGTKIDYLSPLDVPYMQRIASTDPAYYNMFPDAMTNTGPVAGLMMSSVERSKIDGLGGSMFNHDYLWVTTAYWRSQRREGKLHWINPVTNQEEIKIIDETFEVPKYIKQIKNKKFNYNAGINTIIWTRTTEIWQGIKISNYYNSGLLQKPIYLDIRPHDVQIGKLPIAGHFANNINTKPTSLVDKVKPWQWLFNVLMNQSVLWIQTEILPFLVMPSDMISVDKDWAGDDALMRWVSIASDGGIGVIQGGPDQNGNVTGGQFPREVNLDRSARILARIQFALQIRQLALDHIGMSPQRMGQMKASETATGIQQAITNSGVQTSMWFTSFFEGEKDMLQLQLDFAKYLQANGMSPDIANKADLSLEALRMAMDNEELYELHIYVTDSQEELKNLQTARQLALENNTSDMLMSDRIKLSTSTSIVEIIEELKESERKQIERMQQDVQLKQQQLEQQGMQAQEALAQAERHFQQEIQKDIQIALIQAMGRQQNNDANADGQADIIEYSKVLNDANKIINDNKLAQEDLAFKRQVHNDQMNQQNEERRENRRKELAEMALEKEKLKRDTVRGDKSK